jgi:ABC-2 type transport system permease protein
VNGFRTAFVETLLAVFKSKELLGPLVLGVILYAFYFPLPFAQQVSHELPLVLVDQENSGLTRRIARDLSTTRQVEIVAEAASLAEAEELVRDRRADGILLLPNGLTRSLLTQAPPVNVGIWVNGTYVLRASNIGDAISAVISGAAQDMLAPAAQQLHLRRPVEVILRPLFNTYEGFKDYIFPAVANIILQQTLLIGAAVFMGARRERGGEWRMPRDRLLGSWTAIALFGTLGELFYFGLIFWLQDVPRGGNIGALLFTVPIFAFAVTGLGLFIGSFVDKGYRAMQLIAPTSVPLFFLTGAVWPLQAMPHWLAVLSDLSPATVAVHLFVRLNQMGASLAETRDSLAILIGLAVVYGGLAIWRIGLPITTTALDPDRNTEAKQINV